MDTVDKSMVIFVSTLGLMVLAFTALTCLATISLYQAEVDMQECAITCTELNMDAYFDDKQCICQKLMDGDICV